MTSVFQRFSVECSYIKMKVATLADHSDKRWQSNEPSLRKVKTCSRRKGREKALEPITIGSALPVDWTSSLFYFQLLYMANQVRPWLFSRVGSHCCWPMLALELSDLVEKNSVSVLFILSVLCFLFVEICCLFCCSVLLLWSLFRISTTNPGDLSPFSP